MEKIAHLRPVDESGALRVVVESPRGSTIKLKYDAELGLMTYGRPLPLGLAYPGDWGFVPGTRGADGDPIDALIVTDTPSFPGVVVSCRAVGVIRVEQDDRQHRGRARNDRVVAVPLADPRAADVQRYDDLPERVRAELDAFFLATVAFENKRAVILGHGGPEEAAALVESHRV